MRLTLRTLLAYLDDQLEPTEVKQIGQKVAESDAAQELIARIRQVTRRRRLTTPPDGGAGERFDPNTVAGYLDNELPSEQIAEIEKICLESDVHLAEIAACHQILTLVLGEPALVPPTANKRMYALVHGRRPRAARKPAPAAAATLPNGRPAPEAEADETLLLDAPLFRRAPWLRWLVPLVAVLLLAALAGVLWKTMSGPAGSSVATNGSRDEDPTKDADKDRAKQPEKDGPPPPSKDKKEPPPVVVPQPGPAVVTPKDKPGKPDNGGVKPIPASQSASMERHEAGKFTSRDEVLVRKPPKGEGWERVPVSGVVHTGEALVSLPGYRSTVDLNKGVRLLLWGNVPEFLNFPLMESEVVLHHNPDFDLDLTLNRGRIYLVNGKDRDRGAATVRLRFWKGEVWDITLEEPDSTVGVELWSIYPPSMKYQENREEPIVQAFLYVTRGKAALKAGYQTFGGLSAPPGRTMFAWVNKTKGLQGPIAQDSLHEAWNPDRPLPAGQAAQAMRVARDEIATQLTKPGKGVQNALDESTQEATPARRMLGIRCLGAIGAIESVLDELGDPKQHPAARREAALTLRHWLARDGEQFLKLYDKEKKTGLLVDKRFRPDEARTILDLLDGIGEEERKQPETYAALIAYLRHNRLEVRELAFLILGALVPAGQKIPYDPAGTTEQRDRWYEEWKRLIPDGMLPPAADAPMPPRRPGG